MPIGEGTAILLLQLISFSSNSNRDKVAQWSTRRVEWEASQMLENQITQALSDPFLLVLE